MKKLFNYSESAIRNTLTIIIVVFVFFMVRDVDDSVRYPYMIFAVLAFVSGIMFLSNRWSIKVVSGVVGLLVVPILAGSEPDVRQVFVYLPFLLGIISQTLVILRVNHLDKQERLEGAE